MSITYTPTTNFGAKDSLPANDPAKVIKGAEFTTEYTAIQSAFALAAPAASPTITGTATFDDVSITNGLTVDGTTLVVDDTNNRVGIGTSSPDNLLTVGGTTQPRLLISANGDAGASQLNFGDASDTDVGRLRYDHSDNSMSFFTSASEAMRISSSGNVGIGTDSPSKRLTVYDTNPAFQLATAASGNTTLTYTDSTQTADLTVNASVGQLAFGTNSTERLRIDSAGRVGIGEDAPQNLLHLKGDPKIRLEDASPVATSILDGSSGNLLLRADLNAEQASTYIAFLMDGDSEKMRIDSNGHVGIGTDPVSSFHVADAGAKVRIESTNNTRPRLEFYRPASVQNWQITNDAATLTTEVGDDSTSFVERHRVTSGGNHYWNTDEMCIVGGKVGIGESNPQRQLVVSGTGAQRISLVSTDSSGATILFGDSDSDAQGQIAYINSDDSMRFSTAGSSEMMRIDSSGNVGIGQTSPTDLLTVGNSSYTASQEERVGVVIGDTSGLHVRAGFGIKTNSGGTSRLSIETATGTSGGVVEVITANSNGNVGIGEETPARKLHVGDAMRLEPTSTPASPSAGDLYFDSTTNKLRCYDGTTWQDCF